MPDGHRLHAVDRCASTGDVDSVAYAVTDPRKRGSRQAVRGDHPECPCLETSPRRTADAFTEIHHVSCRPQATPGVHADEAGDAHRVAGFLSHLARRGHPWILTGLDVTTGQFPTRWPWAELHEHAAASHDRHLRALDRPLDAIDHHRGHAMRLNTSIAA